MGFYEHVGTEGPRLLLPKRITEGSVNTPL